MRRVRVVVVLATAVLAVLLGAAPAQADPCSDPWPGPGGPQCPPASDGHPWND